MISIKTYTSRIAYWEQKLKESRNQSERAELADKIANAKKEIAKLKIEKTEPEVNGIIDAPSVADKKNNDVISMRGRISIGSDNNFRITF